jgi:hypothetical protein
MAYFFKFQLSTTTINVEFVETHEGDEPNLEVATLCNWKLLYLDEELTGIDMKRHHGQSREKFVLIKVPMKTKGTFV